LQVQKYDGLENKERPSPTMEVTLCSNAGMNLGILNHIVLEITSSWYMIVFNRIFNISAARAIENRRQN
jgi:hypothetical protein